MHATNDRPRQNLPAWTISDLADSYPPLRTALDLADPGQELRQSCEVLREHIKSLRVLLGQTHIGPPPQGHDMLALRILVAQAQILERQAAARYDSAIN